MPRTLYQKIANDITLQIEQNTFLPGDKLPSIRKLSKQKQVSMATIQSAYELLEQQQLIESRPQSGFYVRKAIDPIQTEMTQDTTLNQPSPVCIRQSASNLLKRCQQPEIINLGAAIPSPTFLPVKQLQRIMGSLVRKRMDEVVVSVFPPGLTELRQQIARRMADAGCHVSAGEIVITNGCLDALTLCLRAVAKPGDIIAIESPAFVGLLQTIEALGMQAMEIPSDARRGISLDALRLALEKWPIRAVALIPTNNNPQGFTMPACRRQQLIEMLEPYDIPVIEDDLFGELNYSGSRVNAIKSWDQTGNVLYCSSASKSIASGLRVGWVSAGRYQAQVELLKSFSTVGTSTLSQMAIAEFLANGGYDRHLRRIQSAYSKQMQQMIAAVIHYFPVGTRTSHPQGGYILWVRLPEHCDAMALHYQALSAGIGVMPGAMFSTRDQYHNFLRLNCAVPWDDDIDQAIMTLGKLAASQKSSTSESREDH